MKFPHRFAGRYRDKVAIVTGAASGIGRCLAQVLARQGSHVVMVDVQPQVVEAAGKMQSAGGSVHGVVVDVRDAGAVAAVVEETTKAHGRLDFIFNNAGIVVAGDAAAMPPADWKRVVEVNLMGVVNGVQAAYPLMCRQGFGHIVNTGSIAGLVLLPCTQIYSASKSAIITLTRCLRMEAVPHGVYVSLICPGVVHTPMIDGGGAHGAIRAKIPFDRISSLPRLLRPMSPEQFAVKALIAVARREAIVVLPRWMTALWWLDRIAPEFVDWAGLVAYRTFAKKLLEV
jgi:NAD(P)-dependent dehydrogenase (short-subunit alcohol dehydrogenase family)